MTRKKFVKQLMALGYQRNGAEALAIYARCGGWTYEQYLGVERKYNGQLRAFETAAGRVAEQFADAAKQLASAGQKLVDRMKEVFDGLASAWSAVDEVSQWPKENPYLGGGGHD